MSVLQNATRLARSTGRFFKAGNCRKTSPMPGTISTTGMLPSERARELVEEILAGSPDYLVDCAVRGAAGSRAVDVFVDSDNTIGVDRLADISREVAFLLESHDVIRGPYRLNVSSPGVDRPLKLPRQYRTNIGRLLQVHFRRVDDRGYTEVTGILTSADEDGIVVAQEKKTPVCIAYSHILWAKVQLPW